MGEQTFRSPGFYETEIDQSGRTDAPIGVPAGVVGTADKGPAFVPITVGSFPDFKAKFGNLNPKKFGPYAVSEFLKHRTAATFLRVLGAGANSTDTDISNTQLTGRVKNAGFTLTPSAISGQGRHHGGVQMIVAKHDLGTSEAYGMPMFSDNDAFGGSTANLVRGMVLLATGTRLMVLGKNESAVGAFSSPGPDDYATISDGKFKLVLSSTLGSTFGRTDGNSGLKIFTASLDPSSSDYFGKLLNNDPDKFAEEGHLLYADFAVDSEVASAATVGIASGSTSTNSAGVSFLNSFGSFDTRFTAPKTTWFISQPFGTTEYDLFFVEAIDDGEYANKLYKISISNLKASNDQANPHGTFTLLVRAWDDTDANPKVLERFAGVSLNPTADNFIAKVVGDRKVAFNFDASDPAERRLVTSGEYANKSAYIRVVVADELKRGLIPAAALPFGFRGLEGLKTNDNLKDFGSASPNRMSMKVTDVAATSMSGSVLPPVPFRFKLTKGDVDTSGFAGNPGATELVNSALYWGVKFERNDDPLNANVSVEKNKLVESLSKFLGIKKMDMLVTGSGADTFNNNKFTLARVAFAQAAITELTGSPQQHMKEVAYIRNGKPDPSSYTVSDGVLPKRITFGTLIAQTSPVDFNRFTAYAKFTNMMYGGFDGVNILDRDARRMNDKASSLSSGGGAEASYVPTGMSSNASGAGKDNNTVASYNVAVDIMTDPMTVNTNLLAIPGIREPYITDNAAEKTKEYGLAMYVMDMPSFDEDGNRLYDDSAAKPSVDKTVTELETRALDNNYVATYWPNVQVDDTVNKRRVRLPASVAALAALGFNDRVAYPWFAPAGFNRAALDFVSNVDVRLSVGDRDRLQDARINPIASFPREGYVIYGQKTLQQAKSSLDRVNVRRLMLEVRRIIVAIAKRMVFENPTQDVLNQFVGNATVQLGLIQTQAGMDSFQVVMDSTNNTAEDRDANRVRGRIVVVPTRSVEFIAIDFIIANGQVQFV